MTDARLLATNPENSSLVPVACNAQGQLLVNDVVIEGIDNDVTVNGDLTVNGLGDFASINASGNISNGGVFVTTGGFQSEVYSGRNVNITLTTGGTDRAFAISDGDNGYTCSLNMDGSADFRRYVATAGYLEGDSDGCFLGTKLTVLKTSADSSDALTIASPTKTKATAKIAADGSAEFAGGKAGFTKDGHLWCKTAGRNQTVMLNNLVNGLGEWIEYVPSTRLEEKLEEWSEKDKVVISPEDAGET